MQLPANTAAIAVTIALVAGPPVTVGATPVLSFTPGSGTTVNSAQDFSLGWSFTTSAQGSSIVVSLDALQPAANGSEVRLYNSIGTILASALVTNNDPQQGSPGFYSHAIPGVTLAANTTYFIVQDVPALTGALYQVTGITTNPAIAYGDPVGVSGLGGTPTTDLAAGALTPAYFGPNFDVVIPEPAGMAAVASGLLGLAALRRRASNTRGGSAALS